MNELQRTHRSDQIRSRLGIPSDTRHVILFGESSHWDPDWLLTSEEYYSRFVRGNLDTALAALAQEPSRIYSIECIFFLRMYWERNTDKQPLIRHLVNCGRLRLTSSGITTADTLIPRPEAILRDLLMGQEWLRRQGMMQEPRLAYFTDSFGMSPGLPSLLKEAGFKWTAFTRIDGMFFSGCDAMPASKFPLPGSSAEHLLKKERCLDLIWRDPNGAEVLAHWNAFTYGQGDMLAYGGVNRVYLFPMAYPDRSRMHVRKMITSYARQLFPLARTPYVFCPMGFDFVGPTPGLTVLLERYNRLDYPTTGIWAVNCGLDDYFTLLEEHKGDLPLVEMDPLPYWTGFYSSRPVLKHMCHQTIDRLQTIEISLLGDKVSDRQNTFLNVERMWQDALVSNHHDFITGTSPDKVVEGEQIPLLEGIMAEAAQMLPIYKGRSKKKSSLPSWERRDGRIAVQTTNYEVELDEEKGGCLAAMCETGKNTACLETCSADLVLVRESGGLWRMGNELVGGIFKEVDRASQHPVKLQILEQPGELQIISTHLLAGEEIIRTYRFRNDDERILVSVHGRAPHKHTIMLRWHMGFQPISLIMDNPGTLIERPVERHYIPTFWPVQRVLHTCNGDQGDGALFFFQEPGAAAVNKNGDVDLVALRNAEIERYHGWMPMPGQPATGHEQRSHTALFGIRSFGAGKDPRARIALQAQRDLPEEINKATFKRSVQEVIENSSPDVEVIAFKPASRGEGWIMRLMTLKAPDKTFQIKVIKKRIMKAWLCDGRERDLMPLPVRDGKIGLQMRAAFATIRLLMK